MTVRWLPVASPEESAVLPEKCPSRLGVTQRRAMAVALVLSLDTGLLLHAAGFCGRQGRNL